MRCLTYLVRKRVSKESIYAMPCPGCGGMFAFPTYHEQHCQKTLSNAEVDQPTKRRRRRRKKKNAV
jgi:hypothetical protein